MLVILEGCDGTGKTTIARQLAKVLNAEVIHCTRETPNTFEFFDALIRMSENVNIIADRFCYGQFVYQQENERKLTLEDLYTLECNMVSAGAKLIHVMAPIKDIQERLQARDEKTDKPVEEICNKFIEVFNKSMLSPMLWWTGMEG